MAIVIQERYQQRRKSGIDGQRVYHVFGTDDAEEARNEAFNQSDLTWGTLVRRDPSAAEAGVKNGFLFHEVTVPYSAPGLSKQDERPALPTGGTQPPPPGQSRSLEYSFQLPSTPYIIKKSYGTRIISDGVKLAFDFSGMINVSGNSASGWQVDGVQIQDVAPSVSITIRDKGEIFDQEYLRKVQRLQWTTNKLTCLGRAIGEMLFVGLTGRVLYGDGISSDLTFHFAESPRRQNFQVGAFTIDVKEGWEYLWAYYFPTVDGIAKGIIVQPRGIYLETVYLAEDWSPMGAWATEAGPA